MRRVHGIVQHYAWGDHEFIPKMLGHEPDGRPWAELWLGTHPNGPSWLDDDTELADVTGPLPYLLKVLAAAEPLSLQTHPDADQAVDGHRRGVYPDDRPKPELLCALTPFTALCGVRPPDATVDLLTRVGADELAAAVRADGPGGALEALYRGRLDPVPVIDACRTVDDVAEARWVTRLDERYPAEPSVAATLLLNLVELAPGEGLHLDAGNLHAYLHGAGVELMGASDNVVRGGLTVKHVDVDELLHVVDPTPLAEPRLAATGRYDLPEVGVQLRVVSAGSSHTSVGHELAVDARGGAWYVAPGEELHLDVDAWVVTTPDAT